MMRHLITRSIAFSLALCVAASAQQTPPQTPPQNPPQTRPPQQQQPQQQPQPQILQNPLGVAPSVPYELTPQYQQDQARKQQEQGQQPGQQPPAQPGQPPATQPVQNGQPITGRLSDTDSFSMDNVSLVEMVDLLAKRLKINYIRDPKVAGAVTIHTYGQMTGQVDLMALLQTILRVNGAAIVQVGNLYHVVPINSVSNLPTDPISNADPKTLPDDERMVLNLIFLKYTTAGDMEKLLDPFFGEGARHSTYEPANLLILEDNSRSMKRVMELVGMFDSDTFAGQRVKLFDVTNSKPSDLVKDLDSVFRAYAFSEKSSAVHFIGLDHINLIIAVAPNPGIFAKVKEWIEKLDIPVKVSAGGTQMWTTRMRYQRAEVVAAAIMALYSGNPTALINMANSMNNSMMQAGMGFMGSSAGMGGGGMAVAMVVAATAEASVGVAVTAAGTAGAGMARARTASARTGAIRRCRVRLWEWRYRLTARPRVAQDRPGLI